jgi:ADP-ribosylation factor related protein 1
MLTAKQDYYITILGLDNAGKTTFLQAAQRRTRSGTIPTVGLNIGQLEIDSRKRLKFWDLGGQTELQSLWEKYYDEAHAIIFVVDSTDRERIGAVREALETVLINDKVEGLPILMLANKQDMPDALSVSDIQTIFNKIAELLSARDSKVLPISALEGTGVKEALDWLVLRLERNSQNRPPVLD